MSKLDFTKVLYLKYGELCLKGKNRSDFSALLNQNLKYALLDFDYLDYEFYYDYILISNIKDHELKRLIEIIQLIPGFSNVCIAYKTKREIVDVVSIIQHEFIEPNLKDQQVISFKIEAKRSDKSYEFNSEYLKKTIASQLLSLNNERLKVDLVQPKVMLRIDVKKDCFILYGQKFTCINGLPVGSSGKLLVLISGGIDSPIAARLLLNRGFNVDFITFITPPYTKEEVVDKIIKLIKQVTLDYRIQVNTSLYVCNFTNLMHEISHISKENYRINILRRSFLRISKSLAIAKGYQAVATGESLGQVASQTIESMVTINSAVDDFLVLRPLLTFNKEEIISLSKKYGLYEISILPYSDSCSLFAPKTPITKPKLKTSIYLESQIPFLKELEEKCIQNLKSYKFKFKQ